jgi:hypothetical protein
VNLDKYAAAISEIEKLAGTNVGELKIDLQRIATKGAAVGSELLAGVITPEQAVGNFEDLTRAARARLQAQALNVAAAAQGIQWFDVALAALKVVKVVL